MPWTAALTKVSHDPANPTAVTCEITYTDSDTQATWVQSLTTANPDADVPDLVLGRIAQLGRIAAYVAAPPIGPVDTSAIEQARADRAAKQAMAASLQTATTLKAAIDVGALLADDPSYVTAVQAVVDATAVTDPNAALAKPATLKVG